MAEFTNYLENKLLDHVLNNASFTSPTTANVLGFFGLVGLSFYTLYFAHFLLIRLGIQGRSALQQ